MKKELMDILKVAVLAGAASAVGTACDDDGEEPAADAGCAGCPGAADAGCAGCPAADAGCAGCPGCATADAGCT